VVVSDAPERLPLFPLSKTINALNIQDVVSYLVAISARNSDHHDGFHVISSTWQLTRVAQYFSPPIVPDAQIDRSKRFGGRYLAALFGSEIPGVLVSGIASVGFGIAVFRGGKEVSFEGLK
jgi:DNA integrity scanning protein DisA with diadenylate cyclase activity